MILLSSARVRSIISECKTEIDLVCSLRLHKIKYFFTTESGFLELRIPCRKGNIRIFRSCSRSAPFRMISESAPVYHVPVYHND